MRYILGVISIVLVLIIAIFLLSRRDTTTTTSTGQRPGGKEAVKLLDYEDNTESELEWTMQGRLVGETERRAVRVVVNQRERKLEILDGYQETVERSQTFVNSPAAYETFLHALNLAGFSKERDVPIKDERGVCPLGNVFIYDLTDGSDHPVRLWSASCNNRLGTFAGDAGLIRQMFQNQIPDYSKQIRDVRL